MVSVSPTVIVDKICGSKIRLLPHQLECFTKGFNKNEFVDNNPLGFGKSAVAYVVTMGRVLENPGEKVIVAGTSNVINSLIADWERMYGLRESDYIYYKGIHRDKTFEKDMKNVNKAIIFVTIGVLRTEMMKSHSCFFNTDHKICGIILDEIHKLTTGAKGVDAVKKLLNTFDEAKVWAASATQDKKSLKKALGLICQTKKVTDEMMTDLIYRTNKDIVYGTTRTVPLPYCLSREERDRYLSELHAPESEWCAMYRKTQMALTSPRLQKEIKEVIVIDKKIQTRIPDPTPWISTLFRVIIEKIEQNVLEDKLSIVFFNNTTHLKLLQAILNVHFNPDPSVVGVRIEALTGDLPEKDRLTLMKNIADPPLVNPVKILLASYAICSTSVNLHGSDPRVLIMAQLPLSKETYTQTIGRVSGRYGSGDVEIVIPLVQDTTADLMWRYLTGENKRVERHLYMTVMKTARGLMKPSPSSVVRETEEDNGDSAVAEEDRLDQHESDHEEDASSEGDVEEKRKVTSMAIDTSTLDKKALTDQLTRIREDYGDNRDFNNRIKMLDIEGIGNYTDLKKSDQKILANAIERLSI